MRIRNGTIWTCYKTVAPATFTGQTSYAANGTTPTLLLRKASAKLWTRPMRLDLSQAGTVAGGLINIVIKIDATDRLSSGGSAWLEQSVITTQSDDASPEFTVLDSATAMSEAATEPRTIFHGTLFQTVTASGTGFVYDFDEEDIIGPTGSLLIYTYAATTGPTWQGTLTVREE